MKVHFMGIGGSGISAIAQIARDQGHSVSGCDLEESSLTYRLRKEGIPVAIGHSASHLKQVALLVHTPAVFYQSVTSPEYVQAAKKKIALTWEEFMARYLQKGKFVVAVAGTHGKGTTAAMLSWILEQAGLDPTCEIGANLLGWDRKNYRIGQSKFFICEADEFREKFLLYKPDIAIITSIEMDHPEYFENVAAVLSAFKKFAARAKIVIAHKSLRQFALGKKVIYYQALSKKDAKLKLPGIHLQEDAAGAWAAAKALGVSDKDIKQALESFSGLERRFEFRGEVDGVKIYDDYAHHPTAVVANIKAARELYPKKKIWVVFQAHMHARLQTLFADFVKSLQLADRVVVTDVFTRRESGVTKPSGKELAIAIGSPRATYVGGDLTNVANFIARNTKKGDVVLVLGAGDVYKVSDYLLTPTKT